MFANHVGMGSDSGNSSGGINGWESAAEEAGIELSLGLSLNGRFGVDPSKDGRQITRSSSMSMFPPFDVDNINQLPAVAVPVRAHSLPIETQAEKLRKRKELQSLRCSEARKRRMDKLKTQAQTLIPAPTLRNGALPGTQNSVGSLARSFSALSQLESLRVTVTAVVNPVIANADQAAGSSQSAQGTNDPPSRRRTPRPRADSEAVEKKVAYARQTLTNMMMEMPRVTTVGNGPNRRQVDGLLYRYTSRGEEVKILCVCHGSFMSPAEFWRHAGSEDVENPLKHIVVSPSLVL